MIIYIGGGSTYSFLNGDVLTGALLSSNGLGVDARVDLNGLPLALIDGGQGGAPATQIAAFVPLNLPVSAGFQLTMSAGGSVTIYTKA